MASPIQMKNELMGCYKKEIQDLFNNTPTRTGLAIPNKEWNYSHTKLNSSNKTF